MTSVEEKLTHLKSPGVSSNPAKASLDLIDDDQTSELTNVTKNSIENDNLWNSKQKNWKSCIWSNSANTPFKLQALGTIAGDSRDLHKVPLTTGYD